MFCGVLVTIAIACFTAGADSATATREGALPAADEAARVLRKGMVSSGVPGYALVAVSSRGVADARGFGETGEGRRVTADTPFVLGSASKTFTALAVMQLVERGKIDLDAPVERYVPEFEPADPEAGRRITVRDVLRHTSGIPATAGGPVLRSVTDGPPVEAVKELRGVELAAEPGAEFIYANANYVLAGMAVERASGEPYARYIERHIFAPLGMRDSFTSLANARRAGLATGHRYLFGWVIGHGPTVRSGIQASGYLISSARDMGRYLSMYLHGGRAANGTRIVSKKSLAAMFTPGPDTTLGPWADRADSRYGLGWYIGGPWSKPAMLHPGRTPDSGSLITLFPGQGFGVATLVNAANQVPVPGYPASIDRAQRNAVDAAVGDPVEAGTSLPRFYLRFDLLALALVAAASWLVIRSLSSLRSGPGPRRTGPALIGIGLAAGIGLLLALFPAVSLGWGTWFLWQPDLAFVIALIAAMLILSAGIRTATVIRSRRPGQPFPGRSE